jgi:hypothetical protein
LQSSVESCDAFAEEGLVRQIILTGFALAVVVGSAFAHHSFAQYYFEERSITVEGDLVRFDYQNPHAWVYFDAKDEQGMTQQYSAEWANPNRLSRDNISKDTLTKCTSNAFTVPLTGGCGLFHATADNEPLRATFSGLSFGGVSGLRALGSSEPS